jgi:hypothetical protein
MKLFIIITINITILTLSIFSQAAVIETDTTPTVAEVQSLVDNANAGDIIKFLGGATWGGTVTIGKSLTINGNGTTLTGDLEAGFFNITGFTVSETALVRVTGFTFNLTGTNTAVKVNTMTGNNIRVDHNTFNNGTGTASQILWLHLVGLIDNNYFYNGPNAIDFSAGSRANQDASWASMEAGTVNALYIEDNHFIDDASLTFEPNERIMTFGGGKLVVRYNHFDSLLANADYTITPIMTHGSAGGYWQNDPTQRRGQSVVEIYDNLFEGKRIDFPITVRGAANLIYNNKIGKVRYTPRIYLREEEYDGGQWSPARVNWPAEDQIHNTFIWNNTYDGVALDLNNIVVAPDDASQNEKIKLDRDYFLHAPCGASNSADAYGNTCTHGKETFTKNSDCTGPLTPYKCCTGNETGDCRNGGTETYPTDGETYATKGQMIFTATGDNEYLNYTPYTYPHLLRGEVATATQSYTITGVQITGGN